MRTEKVVVEKWNPQWRSEFEKIVHSLGEEVRENTLRIEHIGSTSVEGLSSKNIIDLDLVIEDMEDFPKLKESLEKKGYIHEGDLGIKGREAFCYEKKPNRMPHHLYVCPRNSPELYRHIKFRDYLRGNTELIEEYSKIKEEAAQLYPSDIDKYMEHKSAFIEKIYKECGLI